MDRLAGWLAEFVAASLGRALGRELAVIESESDLEMRAAGHQLAAQPLRTHSPVNRSPQRGWLAPEGRQLGTGVWAKMVAGEHELERARDWVPVRALVVVGELSVGVELATKRASGAAGLSLGVLEWARQDRVLQTRARHGLRVGASRSLKGDCDLSWRPTRLPVN